MVSIKDYGIDKLPEDQRLELANQIWESLSDTPPGIWDEDELAAEELRRNEELDLHPERALTLEQLRARIEKRS
jgi:putative addiction module component (TIGR02574 family)